MTIKKYYFLIILFLSLHCSSKKDPDFLGTSVIKSNTRNLTATTNGIILNITKKLGYSVNKNEIIAIIDTIPTKLKLNEMYAIREELNQTILAKKSEIASLQTEIRGLAREYGRIGGLADKGSIPTQQKDNLGTKVESANLNLKSKKHLLKSLKFKIDAIDVKILDLKNQLNNCYIKSPFNGTITEQYKNVGDFIKIGSTIFTIANSDTVYADFFVPTTILSEISYGDTLQIKVKTQKEEIIIPSRIIWISDKSEFNDSWKNQLVYRIKITAPNSKNILKRGMRVEIWK